MYASETWAITRKEERKIASSEMIFLRNTVGYSILDRYRNEDTRTELNIQGVHDRIQDYKHTWCEHLERMQKARLPVAILNYKPGKRDVGRLSKRWVPE